MTWFEALTGLREDTPDLPTHWQKEGDTFVFPNGRRAAFGRLETPTLAELRARVRNLPPATGRMQLSELVADAGRLHADPAHANALFQVASQFNLLEMTSPSITPEHGVGIYENDRTQGPACAIACGAGTIYRNYVVPVGGGIGQSTTRQIDCAADLGERLGNRHGRLWSMQNGYLLPAANGLDEITSALRRADENELDHYRASLRIGLQWDADVTIEGAAHRVSQAYCSALPIAYATQAATAWQPFAQLVLEAAYEATLCAAILNATRTGVRRVFLTLLGGGAFGNPESWILSAIARAARLYRAFPLDVSIVSFGRSKPAVVDLVRSLRTDD